MVQTIVMPQGTTTLAAGEYYFETADFDAYQGFLNRYLGPAATDGSGNRQYWLVLTGYYITGWIFRRTIYTVLLRAAPPPVPPPSLEISIGPIRERPQPKLDLSIGPISFRPQGVA